MQAGKSNVVPGGRFFASVAFSASLLVYGGFAHAGSIEDSIRAAIQTNPEVGVVREDRLAVDQELRQANALRLPTVDVRAAVGPEYSNSPATRNRRTRPADGDGSVNLTRYESQVTLSQMLFDGFATTSEIDRQRARVNSASYRVNEAAEFIGLDAVETHLDILRNQELVREAEANLAELERLFKLVLTLEREGAGRISDVHQAEARVASAHDDLASAEGNLRNAHAAFQRVVGSVAEDLTEPLPPVAALPEGSDAAALLASAQSPTVAISTADINVAQAELTGSRAGYYPRFDLELGAGANENLDGVRGGNVDASALLVMRYNLFRGGGDIAREREAFARLNEAREQLARARRTAEEEARLSYSALLTARDRLVALEIGTEANRRTRDAYAKEFDIGQRSLLDLLDVENDLFFSRSSLVTQRYTEVFAIYRVLAVIGSLLDTIDIQRPAESVNIERTPSDVLTEEKVRDSSGSLTNPAAQSDVPGPGAALTPDQSTAIAYVDEATVSGGQTLPVMSNAFIEPAMHPLEPIVIDGIAATPVPMLKPDMTEQSSDSQPQILFSAASNNDAAPSPLPASDSSAARINSAGDAEFDSFSSFLGQVFGE